MSAVHRRAVVVALLGSSLALSVGSSGAHASSPTAVLASSSDPASGWSKLEAHLPAIENGHPEVASDASDAAFRLNAAVLTAALREAPLEHTAAAAGDLPIISIPGADGALHRFTVVDSPVMEPALAGKVAFRSYAATSVDEPGTTARLDYSPAIGFHATVRSPSGSWNVDPAYAGQTTTYLAHFDAFTDSPSALGGEDEVLTAARSAVTQALPVPGGPVTQRVYRLALANDPGYAALVGTADVDTVKAALVNRVNEIYNDDMAIKFVLVANNDSLNLDTAAKFTGAGGPCGATACFTPTGSDDLSGCTGEKIEQTALAITAIIGQDEYDVGHILDTGTKGGIASTGGVGQDAVKGAGCSGDGGTGRGDLLAVEFLSHELGHQFGASHVYSSTSCGAVNPVSSVEIASGATIMSYAGTCAGADNIQTPSDPYFSQFSIQQMQAYINSTIDPADNGGEPAENGGAEVTTSNHAPVVTVPTTAVIPVRTPFTLAGTVTDPDAGQVPVNLWEQNDAGTPRPLTDNSKTDGPLFRPFSEAAVSPLYDPQLDAPGLHEASAAGSARTFPDQAQIAAGDTNAATGTCTNDAPPTQDQIECFAEFLPTSARTLHFDLTARDRFVGGGGVTTAETVVTVAGTTPFAVTNAAASTPEASQYTVTWSVAGTTAAPFGVANVKISYSTDGGLTFPTVLAASTPNDGSQAITVPLGTTSTARFKVEAIGQPFFDISHANLTVTAGVAPAFTASTPPASGTVGSPYSYTYAATGIPAPTFALASGTLPPGLALNPTTGALSGAPTAGGTFTFAIQASNGIGSPVVSSATVTIKAAPVFTASTPPPGTVGAAYSYTYAATGNPTPSLSLVSGTPPTGLVFNAGTGALTGTPAVAGTFTFAIRASNGIGSPAVSSATVTISATPVIGPDYIPLPPARLADTRTGGGTVDGHFAGIGTVASGTTLELSVAGRGGVPIDAVAATLNVTVTQAAAGGYVTVFPCGAPQPNASNLNFDTGGTIPNAVVTKLGTAGASEGKVCIFASQTLHLIVDVNGAFPPTTTYAPINPARVLDTRTGGSTTDHQQEAGGPVAAGSITTLQITGRAGVPADASAVVLNTTITQPTAAGYATVYPCGTEPPTASNLNFTPGLTIPNLVVAKIGSNGAVCIFATSATQLIADVVGYFPATTGYKALVPARLLDTRPGAPTIDGVSAGADVRPTGSITVVHVAGRGGVPADAATAVLNVTVTGATGSGYVTVYPCGIDPPNASNLNFTAGQTIPNAVITKIGSDGNVCLFNSQPTQLTADVAGYFP